MTTRYYCMNIITILIFILILVTLIFVGMGREKFWVKVFGPADLGPIVFESFTPSNKPNHALSCPEGYCANAATDFISPIFNENIDTLKQRLLTLIASSPNTSLVANNDNTYEYRFVQYTKLMRFPDTIRVKFIALDSTQSTFAIYSESQIGHSDLGVNYQRIEIWLKALSTAKP